MKATLVIDMPEACLDCPFEDFLLNSNKQIVEDKPICELEPGLGILEDEYDRPTWCPLKPLPKRKNEYTDIDAIGWNALLELIKDEKDSNE